MKHPKPDQSLEIYTPKEGEDHPHLFDSGVHPIGTEEIHLLVNPFKLLNIKMPKITPTLYQKRCHWPTHLTNVRETYSLEAVINQ